MTDDENSNDDIDVGPVPDALKYTGSGAVPEGDSEYRYQLWRVWDSDEPLVCYVMLNPSHATDEASDNTMTRAAKAAAMMGFGGMIIVNLFALRSENPGMISDHPNPVGPDNDEHIQAAITAAESVFAAWGETGSTTYRERAKTVVNIVESDLYVLTLTKGGHPHHPARLSYDDVAPVPYTLE